MFRLPELAQEGKPQEVSDAFLWELKSTHDESEMNACLQEAKERTQKHVKMLKSGDVPRFAHMVSKFAKVRAFAVVRCGLKVKVEETS